MPARLRYDPAAQLAELHISGVLKRTDMAECEKEIARHIDSGDQPRILVLLENFGGWQQGEDWANFDFMFSYGDQITRMAIVGADVREAEVKAFTGAGLRPTPIEFFGEAGQARAWLLE